MCVCVHACVCVCVRGEGGGRCVDGYVHKVLNETVMQVACPEIASQVVRSAYASDSVSSQQKCKVSSEKSLWHEWCSRQCSRQVK